MTVVDSPKCVAYHFKKQHKLIRCAVKDPEQKFDLDYMKRYTTSLANKAAKTKTQKRICSEIKQCASLEQLLYVVDRVIHNGSKTEFINYM